MNPVKKKSNPNIELSKLVGLPPAKLNRFRKILKNCDSVIIQKILDDELSVKKVDADLKRKRRAESIIRKDQAHHTYTNDCSTDVIDKVINFDVLDASTLIPDEIVTLIFTSFPFAVGKSYSDGVSDNYDFFEYLSWIETVMRTYFNKLRLGGRVALEFEQIYTRDKVDRQYEQRRHIEAYLFFIMKKLGYCYRDTLIWDKGKLGQQPFSWGTYCSPANPVFRRLHSTITLWSKGQWNLPCVSGVPSEIDKCEFDELTRTIWRVTTETQPQGSHVCPMPVKLAERIVRLLTFKNDVVCDIFGGSGTTAVAALRNNRRYIHIDASETYCVEAKARIAKEQAKFGKEV